MPVFSILCISDNLLNNIVSDFLFPVVGSLFSLFLILFHPISFSSSKNKTFYVQLSSGNKVDWKILSLLV